MTLTTLLKNVPYDIRLNDASWKYTGGQGLLYSLKKLMTKIELKSTCEILSSLHVLEPTTLVPLSTTQNLIQFLPPSSTTFSLDLYEFAWSLRSFEDQYHSGPQPNSIASSCVPKNSQILRTSPIREREARSKSRTGKAEGPTRRSFRQRRKKPRTRFLDYTYVASSERYQS